MKKILLLCLLSAGFLATVRAGTQFNLDSSPNSYTGYENNYDGLGPLRIKSVDGYWFSVNTHTPSKLNLGIGQGPSPDWTFHFQTADAAPLVVGHLYQNAERFPWTLSKTPGLEFTSPERANNTLSGSFIIRELKLEPTGMEPSVAVDFIQYDEKEATWWNMGQIRYNSDYPIVANPALDTLLATPSITVTSPKGGEAWQIGSAQTIKWSGGQNPLEVMLETYSEGELVVSGRITTEVNPSTGQHTWRVGDIYNTTNDSDTKHFSTAPPGNYFIRVNDFKTGTLGRSDAFTITPPLSLKNFRFIAGNANVRDPEFQFEVRGIVRGARYRIENSVDLKQWETYVLFDADVDADVESALLSFGPVTALGDPVVPQPLAQFFRLVKE